MEKLFPGLLVRVFGVVSLFSSSTLFAFELLSEGAMGSVSAVSANTAEEIVSVAGSTAAGLRVDDDYESLPFQTDVTVAEDDIDDASQELDFALTQEVEGWADNLRAQGEEASTELQIGYVDELPPSSFDDAVLFVRDSEFDQIIFEPDYGRAEESTIYELGRVEQTVTILEQNLDSVEYNVVRRVEFAATIDAHIGDPDTPSIGSGYISDLSSQSNVRIATVRD